MTQNKHSLSYYSTSQYTSKCIHTDAFHTDELNQEAVADASRELVNLEAWLKNPNVRHVFQCQLVRPANLLAERLPLTWSFHPLTSMLS